jgi:nucleoside-diphosphate-sugar epimerase
MAKYCIIGRKGFIGSALEKGLGSLNVSSYPTKDTEILFHFGSTVHPPFEENPDFHMNEIITSFLFLLPYCRDHHIRFVYPSSALVYEKDTTFTKTKKIMELMASCYPDTLGLRIFPVYGPGEHRTVISQWCAQMKKGMRPVIWGDGNQKRDFIYIDDAVDQILFLAKTGKSGVRDVGVGNPTSFNQIYTTINSVLGTHIQPIYQKSPEGYSKGIVCQRPGDQRVSLINGLKKLLESKI